MCRKHWLVICFVLLWLPWSGFAKEPKQVEKDAWESLNTKAMEAYHAGRYQEGLVWAQKAYD